MALIKAYSCVRMIQLKFRPKYNWEHVAVRDVLHPIWGWSLSPKKECEKMSTSTHLKRHMEWSNQEFHIGPHCLARQGKCNHVSPTCDCCGPQLTATTSLMSFFSFSLTASSTAISQKGFIECFTPSVTTPLWSGFTRIWKEHERETEGFTRLQEQTIESHLDSSGCILLWQKEEEHTFAPLVTFA